MKRRIWGMAWMLAAGAGCGGPAAEGRHSTTVADDPGPSAEQGVPPEKMEELDQFFHGKMGPLQFECYNTEVERTGKKYQGNLTLSLVVNPGGKASDVKVTGSSLGSPGIEKCVVEAAEAWQWPDVPARAAYEGSINFKPAW